MHNVKYKVTATYYDPRVTSLHPSEGTTKYQNESKESIISPDSDTHTL